MNSSKIRAALLANYAESCAECGLDPRRELGRVGLNIQMINQPDLRIPVDAVVELMENSAERSGNDCFGIDMAKKRRLSDFGAVNLVLKHQHTLLDALRITIEYRHILNEALLTQIEPYGETVFIREDIIHATTSKATQALDYAVGVLFMLCKGFLGDHWRPRSISMTRSAPRELSAHRRFFNCAIEFNASSNGLICSRDDLQRTNTLADPIMAQYARRFLDQSQQPKTLREEIEHALILLLPMGRATLSEIAQSLKMHERTLQRRLEREDLSFSAILNETRRSCAMRYLNNHGYTLQQITDLLGYSATSVFCRWFLDEFKLTPTQWRTRPH